MSNTKILAKLESRQSLLNFQVRGAIEHTIQVVAVECVKRSEAPGNLAG